MPDSAQTSEPLAIYGAQINPALWTVLRLDGRSFSRRAVAYRRPFDPDFHAAMRTVVEVLMDETPALAAHTASDEISLLFAPDTEWFSERLDKWLSTTASIAGAAMTRHLTRLDGLAACDARAFAAADLTAVREYLSARIDNSRRNCRNAYAYFGLHEQGKNPREAERVAAELTRAAGDIFPPATPSWERHGAFVRYLRLPHTGFNPQTNTQVATTRRRLAWLEIDNHSAIDQLLEDLKSAVGAAT